MMTMQTTSNNKIILS